MMKNRDFARDSLRAFCFVSAALCLVFDGVMQLSVPAMGDPLNAVTEFFSPGSKAPDDSSNGVIDYRPRPALVVPPTNDLPPPQTSANPTPAPNWPKASDSTALKAAKADSRRPAPTMDSQVNGNGAGQAVYLPDSGPNCNSFLGMPMCFGTPWGQEVALPGAVKNSATKGIVLNGSPTRQYLTDPPANYLQAVQLSQVQDAATQNGTVIAAAGAQEPPQKCMLPGWFGCPEYQGDPQSVAAAQANAAAPDMGLGAATQKCMFPGMFGCPANPPAQSVAAAGPPPVEVQPAGGPASVGASTAAASPPGNKCMFPGWFGCPAN